MTTRFLCVVAMASLACSPVALAGTPDAALAKAFGDKDLDRRAVFVHGILESTELPASVASLGTVLARVTLPIACGEIKRVQQ